jgi:hypothetical protein
LKTDNFKSKKLKIGWRKGNTIQNKEVLDRNMAELDNRIELLSSSRPDIVNNIDHLTQLRADLMKELN